VDHAKKQWIPVPGIQVTKKGSGSRNTTPAYIHVVMAAKYRTRASTSVSESRGPKRIAEKNPKVATMFFSRKCFLRK